MINLRTIRLMSCVATAALLIALSAGSPAWGQLVPRQPLAKRPYQLFPDRPHRMVIKFVDAMKARCSQGVLSAQNQGMLNEVQPVVQQYNLLFTRLLHSPYPQLIQLEQRAASRSGKAQPDLGGMMLVHFPAAASELAVATHLLELDAVEFVINEVLDNELGCEPPPCDIAPTTPLFVGLQDFHGPDPGLDMGYAWSRTRTGSVFNPRGLGLRITDVECTWKPGHEDLDNDAITVLADLGLGGPGAASHANFVMGITSAVENDYGCTGMIPEAGLQFSAVYVNEIPDIDSSLGTAIGASRPGDVILTTLQAISGLPGGSQVPQEFLEPFWSLTRMAVDTDIVVVAIAGNGAVNLDMQPVDPENPTEAELALLSYHDRPDSGAIIVGGGTSTTSHSRVEGLSTYGTRVNVQAWGENVFTLGCFDLASNLCVVFGDDVDQAYATVRGTSVAAPMVASACVSLQALRKDRLGTFFDLTGPVSEPDDDPNNLRVFLVNTGICQGGVGNCVAEDFEHIGPIPDMRAAIDTLLNDPSVALPFDDPFPALEIDEAKWSVTTGVIDALGDGEPTPPNSMHLGSGQSFETASMVTTEACTIGNEVQATLTFWYQDGNGLPSVDGDLVVRYRDSTGTDPWPILRQIQPDLDPNYVELPIPLPNSALHDALRVRFESDATQGDWFVDNVTLSIITQPEFRLTPFAQTVCEDPANPIDVTFEVEAVGGDLSYQWRKDGENISGALGTTFTIPGDELATDDAGNYTVLVTNACDSVESTPGELTVDVAVSMGQPQGSSEPVACGTGVSVSVTVIGLPTPALQWLRDNVAIPGATSSTLVINPVCPGDEGYYTLMTTDSEACGGEVVESEPFFMDVNETDPSCDYCATEIIEATSVRSHAGEPHPILLDRIAGMTTSESRAGGIQQLDIRFQQPMDPQTAENPEFISVAGVNTGAISSSDILAVLDAAGKKLTITFPALGSIPEDDCYTVELSTSIHDADGEPLSGDRDFMVLSMTGDPNSNGVVDALDFGFIQARLGTDVSLPSNTPADINTNGIIDPLDIAAAQNNFPSPTNPCP